MNISEEKNITSSICSFSPHGKFFGFVTNSLVSVYNVVSFTLNRTCQVRENIDYLIWSPNSLYFMCGITKIGVVYIWSVEDPKWVCKINEGSMGLKSSLWCPDSLHIVTLSKCEIWMTAWSLEKDEVYHTKCFKNSSCLRFSHQKKLLAFIDGSSFTDFLCIVSYSTWTLLKKIQLPTQYSEGIEWSCNDQYIAVWEGIISFKILIVSPFGQLLAIHQQDTQIGIECVAWSPSSQFLAICAANATMYVTNTTTWSLINLMEETKLHDCNIFYHSECLLGKEILTNSLAVEGIQPVIDTVYRSTNCVFSSLNISVEDKFLWEGSGRLLYSNNGNNIAYISSIYPNYIFIWDAIKWVLVHVIKHLVPIKCMAWDPVQDRLAIATNNSKVCIWTSSDSDIFEIPDSRDFKIHNLEWNCTGASLLVNSQNVLKVIYFTD